MVETILSKLAIPLPWALFLLLQAGAGFFWLSKLDSRIYFVETAGSPAAQAAGVVIAAMSNRVGVLEGLSTQIPINSNRLTRLETQVDELQRELGRRQTTKEAGSSGSR